MAPPINTEMTARQWTELLFLSILWGGTFIAVEVALIDLDPLLLVNLRVGLAAFALYAVIRVRRETLPTTAKIWSAFLVMGFLNNALPFSLMFWSQSVITASLASILNAATPIFGVLIAGAVLADEPLTKHRLAGALIGLILGVALSLLQQHYGIIGMGLDSAVLTSYPVKIEGLDVLYTILAIIFITLMASLKPAIKASKSYSTHTL